MGVDSHFVFVSRGNLNLVIPGGEVNLGEASSPCQRIKQVVDQKERVLVLDYYLVERAVIGDQTKQPI